MLQNFFKIAVRVLWKRKSFSLLNILGLAVGLAASLLLFLIIRYELTYEDYQVNKDRVYRVVTTHIKKSNGEISFKNAITPAPLPDAMRTDFPQLEKVAAISNIGEGQIYIPSKGLEEEKRFKEVGGMCWVEPGIFDIFNYQWVAGSPKGLSEPNMVVINESLARKFFDNADAAIGKTFQLWSYRIPLQVTGVFKDLPSNTDLPVRMGASFATLRKIDPKTFNSPTAWENIRGNTECFILAQKGHQYAALQSQLIAFQKKHYKDDPLLTRQLNFQPLKDIHLDKTVENFGNGGLARKEIWSLGLIGGFLLLVACINFINLTTAQSVNRAKEIGVRKVLGSNRPQLMRQFLQETALITFIALILGCILAWIFLPLLNKLMHKNLSLDFIAQPMILVYMLVMGVIVTLLAGIYPALVLSGFKPVMAFKNKVNPKVAGGISLRRGLVVFQFVIAQLLIIGTVVVVKQMYYFRNQSLGFEKDGIVLINLPSDSTLKLKYPTLKSQMQQVPGVADASLCMQAPSAQWAWSNAFTYDNDEKEKDFETYCQLADNSYLNTFGIPLVAGRLPFPSDTAREVVVNELLVKKLGLQSPQDVIGKSLALRGWAKKVSIVGVIKDYNSRPLRDAMAPMVITSDNNAYNWIAVRMKRNNMSSTLENVRKLFTGIYPTYMYEQYFYDETIERFYQNEAITEQLFKIFSFLAILISCLGLYGLVSFMAVQKTKEVGIRKVLGASVQSIVYMFSKEFTLLIALAFFIAAPAGYYFMNSWLSDFYYHTNIGWGVFLLAIFFCMVIAWITVGYKAFKAAMVNPVKSLKSE